jgi:hypothetical protein
MILFARHIGCRFAEAGTFAELAPLFFSAQTSKNNCESTYIVHQSAVPSDEAMSPGVQTNVLKKVAFALVQY